MHPLGNDKEEPDGPTTPEERLRRIAVAFRTGLNSIREFIAADQGDEDAKAFAAERTGIGTPYKHIIAAAFACCDVELASLYGRVRWRCSLSIDNDTKVSKVREILSAVHPNAANIQDDWPKIAEFMHDFSASNFALTEVTGKMEGFAWSPEKFFKLHVAAESETGGGSFKVRRHLITRDLVKLCLVKADTKVLVYAGYPQAGKNSQHRQPLLNLIVETIRRCYEEGRPGGWLFIGLLGMWPDNQTMYLHTLLPGGEAAEPRNDW